LRETTDTVESIGVERSKQVMADSDLVVILLDGSQNLTIEDKEILSQTTDLQHIIAVNKIDLPTEIIQISKEIKSQVIGVSAKTGEGLSELQKAFVEPFKLQDVESSGFLVSDARHNDLLLRAKSEIENSLDLLDQKMSEEIVLIGLHNALRSLGQITGETTTEDMLKRIFSTFCIGK